jgi:3D (Asp-Asp-Asp) domain-containing protein
MLFIATAYCTGTVTATGARVRKGIVAADPDVLPMGSIIRLAGLDRRYDGTYAVMDTGPKIQGRRVDMYVANCGEARRFGRRQARVSIVRRGADP